MTIKFNETTKRWNLGDITSEQLLAIVKGTALLAGRNDHPYHKAKEVAGFFKEKLYSTPMKNRRQHFKIWAKERTTGQIITPEYVGYKSRTEVIEFFGLEEPYIEWYEIAEVTNEDITPKQ